MKTWTLCRDAVVLQLALERVGDGGDDGSGEVEDVGDERGGAGAGSGSEMEAPAVGSRSFPPLPRPEGEGQSRLRRRRLDVFFSRPAGIRRGPGCRRSVEAAVLGGRLGAEGRGDDGHLEAAARLRSAGQLLVAETPGDARGRAERQAPAHLDGGGPVGGPGRQVGCALVPLPIRLGRQIREQNLDRDPPASR